MSKSITRKLQISMYSFGLFMGIVFPFYASLFDSWKSIWFKVGALAAGIMVGFFCYTMVKLILLKEIRKINAFASALKNNDLTASISIESNDTIGAIVTNLSHSTDSIRELVRRIHTSSEMVLGSLHELRGFADSMNSSADEIINRTTAMSVTAEMISKNSADISREVAATAQSVSTIATNANELTESVKTVHEKCQQEVAVTGEAKVLFDTTKDAILELASRSAEIANIVAVIDSIADKTNLLAINAHVEAAQAGVHGKSFAVVAAEVKILADQSKVSATGISNLIGQITDTIDLSRRSITESAKRIDTLTVLAKEISGETAREVLLLKTIDDELLLSNSTMQRVSDRINKNDSGISENANKVRLVNDELLQINDDIHRATASISKLEKESAELTAITGTFRV